MHEDIDSILFSEEDIANRIGQLGRAINADLAPYAESGERIVAICLLKGAAVYMTDIMRQLDLPIEMDFMCVSSYGNGTVSSGNVVIKKDIDVDIEGAHVLIVEDIIDSGYTLSCLRKKLEERNPASLDITALIRKQVDGQLDVGCKYVGFDCPNEFIVGYGLDYAQQYRNLPYIGVLKECVYE